MVGEWRVEEGPRRRREEEVRGRGGGGGRLRVNGSEEEVDKD